MKLLAILILFGICTYNCAISQESAEISVFNSGPIDQPQYAFNVIGPKGDLFLNSIFTNYPKTRRTGYVHKFKRISIRGIIGYLDLQIHEGVHGKGEGNRTYFNTFVNDKYRDERLKCMTENETLGIIIYVRKRVGTYIATNHEVDVFCDFIRSHCTN